MRTVGLLGGMSAESTTYYYQAMNRLVRERLGGLHSIQLLMWSVDFAPIAQMQAQGDWNRAGEVLAQAAQRLERAGAEAIMIGANTMHLVAGQVQAALGVPLLHICDATADAVKILVDAGIIRPDEKLEDFMRSQYSLPARPDDPTSAGSNTITDLGAPGSPSTEEGS